MRLKTLFLGSLTLLLFALMAFTFAITFKNNQKFVEDQLYSASMDTAYAIGVAFATLDGPQTPVDEKTIINAIYDSGYYEYIRFFDANGTLQIEATQPIIVKDVPPWFIAFIPLQLQEASTGVTRHWKSIGTLHIKSHLGYAYAQLYKSFKALLLTYLIVFAITLPLLLLIVNTILRSLKNIDKQAKAVLTQRFVTIDDSSKITEFNTVARSMNEMVKKTESIFTSQAKIYHDYQRHLYRDEESGLYNKKFITMKLTELLSDREEAFVHNQLLMIHADDLVALKSAQGFQKYREALSYVTEIIKSSLGSNDLFARVSDNEFIVLLENAAEEDTAAKIAQLNNALALMPEKLKVKSQQLTVVAALTPIAKTLNTSELFSKADYTLQQARLLGHHEIYRGSEMSDSLGELVLRGKAEWKHTLDDMLSHARLTHIGQNVFDLRDGSIFHHELFMRFQDADGHLHSAAFILPMAKAMDMVTRFDHEMLEHLFAYLETFESPVAVNLSKDFIADSANVQHLIHKLALLPKHYKHKLHFELKESEILEHPVLFSEFADTVHTYEQTIGIDHFSGAEAIDYIKQLRPAYIKISSLALSNAKAYNDSLLHSLNVMAELMKIRIIVTTISDQAMFDLAKVEGYTLVQGYYPDTLAATFAKK